MCFENKALRTHVSSADSRKLSPKSKPKDPLVRIIILKYTINQTKAESTSISIGINSLPALSELPFRDLYRAHPKQQRCLKTSRNTSQPTTNHLVTIAGIWTIAFLWIPIEVNSHESLISGYSEMLWIYYNL